MFVILETRMSDYGYWVVTIGCAPGRRVDIMIPETGITPERAEELALTGVTHVTRQGG
jgi:hypothetical protein